MARLLADRAPGGSPTPAAARAGSGRRSPSIGRSGSLFGLPAPARTMRDHEADAGRVNDEIDDHVAEQRDQHVGAGQRGRHRVRGAHQAIDRPGLAADLGGGPAGEHGDEAERQRTPRTARRNQRAVVEPAAPAQTQLATTTTSQHQQADADHDAEGEEGNRDRRPVLARKSFSPRTTPLSVWVRIRLPSYGTSMREVIGLGLLVGNARTG